MTGNCVFISMVIGKRFLKIEEMSHTDIITVLPKRIVGAVLGQ